MSKNRLGYKSTEPTTPDPERDNRLVPVSRMKGRLGVAEFDKPIRFVPNFSVRQQLFTLLLSQHIGKPSLPIVQSGDEVEVGQMIAKAAEGISAALHTPVAGKVLSVTDSYIQIKAGGMQ